MPRARIQSDGYERDTEPVDCRVDALADRENAESVPENVRRGDHREGVKHQRQRVVGILDRVTERRRRRRGRRSRT